MEDWLTLSPCHPEGFTMLPTSLSQMRMKNYHYTIIAYGPVFFILYILAALLIPSRDSFLPPTADTDILWISQNDCWYS